MKPVNKKTTSRFLRQGSPWVYSNELVSIDTKIEPGSWVSLENFDGQCLGYGYFNPHSLIAFRVFEREKFRSEEQTRALFFKRLDWSLRTRTRAFADRFVSGEMGRFSYRLAFGESDGVPGLVIDLYEPGFAVIQCHSAGADQFVLWTQQWLEERMGVFSGVVKNDLDVRRKENAKLEVYDWGKIPESIHAKEGGVRFFIDPKKGQKTGYFYDHRDNRLELAKRAASVEGNILDCFSYVGSWGLQALKWSPKAKLIAVDVSASALASLRQNAEANGLGARIETIEADFFKDKQALAGKKFGVVISDPPALTSSAKHAAEGKRAHEACFTTALGYLDQGGVAALASCSFHLSWDDFMTCVSKAGIFNKKFLKTTYLGTQGADHPVLTSLPESRYLKAVIVE